MLGTILIVASISATLILCFQQLKKDNNNNQNQNNYGK